MKLSNYINIPAFFLSSKGNGNVSLSIKGILVYLITTYLISNGYSANEAQILGFATELINLGSWLVAIYGIGRKLYYGGKQLLAK